MHVSAQPACFCRRCRRRGGRVTEEQLEYFGCAVGVAKDALETDAVAAAAFASRIELAAPDRGADGAACEVEEGAGVVDAQPGPLGLEEDAGAALGGALEQFVVLEPSLDRLRSHEQQLGGFIDRQLEVAEFAHFVGFPVKSSDVV